jgi:hypothetical protein
MKGLMNNKLERMRKAEASICFALGLLLRPSPGWIADLKKNINLDS